MYKIKRTARLIVMLCLIAAAIGLILMIESCKQTETETTAEVLVSVNRSSEAGRDFVKAWEGLSLEAVPDSNGNTVVGWGHNAPDNPSEITLEEAERLFESDAALFDAAINTFCDKYDVVLAQNQFDALFSFVYNFGVNYLDVMKKRGDSLFDLLVGGAYTDEQLIEEWTAYCHFTDENGDRQESTGLRNRRLAEVNMWLYNIY